MKRRVVTAAYPTIPIVFVSSVHPDRIPLHNTMGLAVTDKEEQVRSETEVTVTEGQDIDFILDGEKLDFERLTDVKKIVDFFMEKHGQRVGLNIKSTNYNIYSGSSDSGMAALVYALNELFETNLSQDELAKVSMLGSESSIRSVYGGINEINVDSYPNIIGKLVASDEELGNLKIFALTFDYESRVSAEQIFQATRSSHFYEYRLKMIPIWVAKIKLGFLTNDWKTVFSVAEENCANAHYLIECAGLRCRKKEMMNACIDVEEIRDTGLPCYWTAGGGKVINVFSWGPDSEKVRQELINRGYQPKEYKVAPGPKIVSSE
jgi:mevalonate pyrophosphate decarboxylase